MKDKLIVFDFDGVLADSFLDVYSINRLAAEHVSVVINEDDFRGMFKGKFHHNLQNFLNLKVEDWNKFLLYKYDIYNDYYKKIKLFPSVVDFVKYLSQIASLAIVSSAPEEAIRGLLEKNNLVDKFIFIFGMNKEGKVANLKKCLELTGNNERNSFFISDTTGDINEGNEAGLNTIAVTWGFHDKKTLRAAKPKFLVDDFSEIVDIIKDRDK